MMICSICPRRCEADRTAPHPLGACGMGEMPVVARVGVHHWEEPCISGTHGSGTIFFSGCSLQCCFCQNYIISTQRFGRTITIERLRKIYAELAAQGVHNINLVNPTHFLTSVAESLSPTPSIPVIYNSGGYELTSSLRLLNGKVQIYLPDLKYSDNLLAIRYSSAPNYFEAATQGILEMYRQVGNFVLNDDGTLQSGLVIRHLILPGNLDNTFGVIDWVAETFRPGQILFSLMAQYTPCGRSAVFPELAAPLTATEYKRVQDYFSFMGIEDGYLQELSSATTEYIPSFDLQGV